MHSVSSLRSLTRYFVALVALASLAACGGSGFTDGAGDNPTAQAPNPITIAPTLQCSTAGVAASNASAASHTVCMLTSSGEIVVGLDAVHAPISVANFLQYVNGGFYSNTIFHRVVPNFVVQGGGYTTGMVAKTGLLAPIALESQNGLSNLRGTIGMARTSDLNSATSQFYFNTVDNTSLDYSSTNPGYAVFGQIISGLPVVDAINALPQLSAGADETATEVLLYWAQQLR